MLTCHTRAVLGLIIGGIFVQFASWPWVFWFVALVALPISAICCFLVPSPHRAVDDLHAYLLLRPTLIEKSYEIGLWVARNVWTLKPVACGLAHASICVHLRRE